MASHPPGTGRAAARGGSKLARGWTRGWTRGWIGQAAAGAWPELLAGGTCAARAGACGAELAQRALERLFAWRPERMLRALPDRQTFWLATPEGTRVVAKRTVGDGDARPWGRWWRPSRSPAQREAENLTALAEAGFVVPVPLAWWEERAASRGWRPRRVRSALLMSELAHSSDLRTELGRDARAARARFERALADVVARLHSAGWAHRDLYLQHVVVLRDGGPAALGLLDLGRALPARRARWFEKDLAALDHSSRAAGGCAYDLGGCACDLAERARLAFFARYAKLRGLRGRAAKRAFLRGVARRSARMAAHAPRHVDPDDASRVDVARAAAERAAVERAVVRRAGTSA